MNIQRDSTFQVRVPASEATRRTASVARQAPGTTTLNTIGVFSGPVLLEVHDSYFHHDSAVMMPDTDPDDAEMTEPSHFEDPEVFDGVRRSNADSYARFATEAYDPGEVEDTSERVPGLGLLVAAYRFQALNPAYRLLLAGHADTSGQDAYNFTISSLRARNVLHLLLGERKPWVDICLGKSKVEDYQRILKHYAKVFGWSCDPGAVDNVAGPDTSQALRNFQSSYNEQLHGSIPVDGVIGALTWGAFFDTYMAELAAMLEISTDQLSEPRAAVAFLDPGERFIAVGERKPIDDPSRDNFRSKENRRVEFLYFRPPIVPDLHCHASTKPFCMKNCALAECGVYAPERFRFTFLEAQSLLGRMPGDYQPQFQIRDSDHDLEELHDKPDDSYSSTMQTSEVSDSDPWGFLEPFAALDPQEGSNEQDDDERPA